MEDSFLPPTVDIICGVDEAGRGPLAGPVVAAACYLKEDFPLHILNDSKKMNEKQLKEAEKIIREQALFSIIEVDEKVIDDINILNASLLAMKKAYLELKEKVDITLVLIDGNKVFDSNNVNRKAIVKGDSKIPAIMAASILAKTHRDRLMIEMDKIYPEYNFKKHKGYPTAEHRAIIKALGPCEIHRKTFKVR